jgi:hypothetical protein
MLSAKQEASMAAEVRPEILLRLDYIRRRAGHWIALATAFVSIWLTCIWTGFVIPMNTLDHGDVSSAFAATIFAGLGGVVGPFIAFFVIRSIGRGGT